MKNAKYFYVSQISKKKYKDFDSLFESDEFNNIQDKEIKKKTFYYFAFQFSSLPNKDINQLYKDLKTISDKIQSNKFLQKFENKIYAHIFNKYLEKIEIFNASMEFYENEKNIYLIRDIIKLFSNHFKKLECPKEVFESLEDLYEIILIKKRHKIPEKNQKQIDRYLKEFKKLIDSLSQKYNFDVKNNIEEKEKENNKDKEIPKIKANENENINNNNNIMNNNNNFKDKNINNEILGNKSININKNNSININSNNNLEKKSNNIQEIYINEINEKNNLDEFNGINLKNPINNIDLNDININIGNINDLQLNDINDNDNINLNNEISNSQISSKNENNKLIYEPEGLDFVKNLLNNKNSVVNENNNIIEEKKEEKEKRDDKEKSETNELYDSNGKKIIIDDNIKIENPFKKKIEQEQLKQQDEKLKKSKNKKKEKKKKLKEKLQDKIDEYMEYAKNFDIDDL